MPGRLWPALRPLLLAFWLVPVLIGLAPSSAHAERLAPQISWSVAVGKSDDLWFGHLWAGAGVHWIGGPADGVFLLAGVEAELRGSAESEEDRDRAMGLRDFEPARSESNTETWLAMRAGVGAFGGWHLAPQAAFYAIAGYRASGPDDPVRLRIGIGASVPAIIKLACLGIPTMLEGGVDAEASGEPSRLFLRTGWNF